MTQLFINAIEKSHSYIKIAAIFLFKKLLFMRVLSEFYFLATAVQARRN